MLLTISTSHQPATDLGYLLHKHPDRFQSFDLSFGQAHVFYPEVSEDRTTAALLLDVDPATGRLISVHCGPGKMKELVTACDAIEFSRLRYIRDQLRTTAVGFAMHVVFAHCFAERFAATTRVRFGLQEPATPEFVAGLKTALFVFELDEPLGRFLSECNNNVPAELSRLAAIDELALNALAQTSTAVVRYIENLSQRAEKLATSLFRAVRPHLYEPQQKSIPGTDDGDSLERRIRDGLHWISVLIAYYRRACFDRFPAGKLLSFWLPGWVLQNIVAQSLFDAVLLNMLRRAIPGFLRPTDLPEGEPQPGDQSWQQNAWNQLDVVQNRFQDVGILLENLPVQWTRALPTDPYWQRVEQALTIHFQRFRRGLQNVVLLHLLGEATKLPKQTSFDFPAWLCERGPNVRETSIVCRSRRQAEQLFADETIDWDAQEQPEFLFHVQRFVGVTNRLIMNGWNPRLVGKPPFQVVIHRAGGEPCPSNFCVIPLSVLFHPEDRIVIAGRFTARQAAIALANWPDLWNALGDVDLPSAGVETYLDLMRIQVPRNSGGLCIPFFLFSKTDRQRWKSLGKPRRVPRGLVELLKRYEVPLPCANPFFVAVEPSPT